MNTMDRWEWAWVFFHAVLDLNESRSTEAANLITGEQREEPTEAEIVNKLKPILAYVHDHVGCENCKPAGHRN